MSLERKASYVWISVACLAAGLAGCALEGAEPTPESTSTGTAELQQNAPASAAHPLERDLTGTTTRIRSHAPIVRPAAVVPLDSPTLPSPGGDTNDDPRPHPWEPQPTDNGQASTGSADSVNGTSGASK